MASQIKIGEYLIRQLSKYGIRHVFGIPGDYILGFYGMLERCEQLRLINTSDEQGAGFAADAYARVSGLGAVCVTYGVGALKIANTTAQAYAEKSPVIVISGAPGAKEVQGANLLTTRSLISACRKGSLTNSRWPQPSLIAPQPLRAKSTGSSMPP